MKSQGTDLMVLYSFLKMFVKVEVYSVTFSETKMNTENR